MADLDNSLEQEPPIWAVFGDLMTGLVGVFVLLLVWALGFQLELSQSLKQEVAKREAEQSRRQALEQALAAPLSQGRITFEQGRIGISGSVLFELNSAELQDEGRALLESLLQPLQFYLSEHDQILMVSGFTDDLPIQEGNLNFNDNWELSAQRALTVTRALIDAVFTGEIDNAGTDTLPIFNLRMPTSLAGLDYSILDPRSSYDDIAEWEKRAHHLGGLFIENFKKFTDTDAGKTLVSAGPQLG